MKRETGRKRVRGAFLQVCFWGTVGQVPREIYWHDALAVLQWRNVARTVARQIDAGNMTTLHLIDWFWPSFGRLDQRFGGHRTKGFNLWVSQLVVNAYHSIAEQRGLISPAVSLVQPSRSYRAEEVECFLLPVVLGVQGRKVKCKKYPLRVGFEKGCMVENQTDYPEIGKRTLTLWARNCTPQVIV